MEGASGRDPLLGNPTDDVYEICKMPCKWASLFIGALLGKLEGVHLPGLLGEMNSISGFLCWARWSLRF
jgi:hypothetical protein